MSAIAEGAITVGVVGALERIQPDFVRQPPGQRSLALAAIALVAVLLVTGGALFASVLPDGIEKLAQARTLIATPLSGYGTGWVGKAGAGLAGLALVYGACVLIGRKR